MNITEDVFNGLRGTFRHQQESQERGRRRQRQQRQREKRLQMDLRRYDSTLEDLRRARKALDDRMAVIDIAHQHSWDVARHYVEKEKPIRNKNLREAIAEAKKEGEGREREKEIRQTTIQEITISILETPI